MADEAPHYYLIDGSGFIYRAFYALPPMSRPDGTPVNAVYGFCSMLIKLLSNTDADHIAVVFDADKKNFRHDIYPEYKANRPEPPEELKPQFSLIREATRAFHVAGLEEEGLEADDLIAAYGKKAAESGADVTVVSGDKDLLQLIGGNIHLQDPIREKEITAADVKKKYGVGPEKIGDMLALAGDSSDNIPGVPGIGVKTAAQLLEEWGSLENLLDNADRIKQPKRRERLIEHADKARLSRRLVTLKTDITLPESLEALAVRPPDVEVVQDFIRRQGFKSLQPRLEKWITLKEDVKAAEKGAKKPSYTLVQDKQTFSRWLEEARQAGRVALDTETDGLDPRRANLVGISLSITPRFACYIPLGHRAPTAQGSFDFTPAHPDEDSLDDQLSAAFVLKALRPLLEDPAVRKIGHNLKFDLHILRRAIGDETFLPVACEDTILMSYALDGSRHGHGMDELAFLHFGIETTPFSEICGSGSDQITFDRVPLEKARDYAAEDADITLRLYDFLKPRLVKAGRFSIYSDMDKQVLPVLLNMEARGVLVDGDEITRISRDFSERMATMEEEIFDLAGEAFNVASPKQLGEILFEKRGLKGGKRSKKTGAWSTSAEVLENLAAEEGDELAAKVLQWRQLAKLKSTYTDTLLEQIHPKTGRIHTTFSQTTTATGRLSSNSPNLQNIPIRTSDGRRIRRAFVAPEGWQVMAADYSQIELRVMAHMADVGGLKAAFSKGEDIHATTAARVFGIEGEVSKAMRRQAKAINFGIIYGISAFGLARQLDISRQEAQGYIDAYFDRFPEIKAYMDRMRTAAKEQRYVETLFGRRCPVPLVAEKSPGGSQFAQRAAINAPIQGTAADIIRKAMIQVEPALEEAGLKARLLLQVHDELVFEVPGAETDRTAKVLRDVMENTVTLSVPLEVEAAAADNWAEAH